MISIGEKKNIAIEISEEIEGQWFSSVSFWLDNNLIVDSETENLDYLCVDFESFLIALNKGVNYNNSYLFNLQDDEITRLWIKFFSAETIEEMEDEEVEFFDHLFCKSRVPFNSLFFKNKVIIGFVNDENFIFKIWDSFDSKNINTFYIKYKFLKIFLESTSHTLRTNIFDSQTEF